MTVRAASHICVYRLLVGNSTIATVDEVTDAHGGVNLETVFVMTSRVALRSHSTRVEKEGC